MAHPAVRAYEAWLHGYRSTWRATVVTSFLNPVLYLAAMGVGLGRYVKGGGQVQLGGYSYLTYLAPGLLAATAMQIAAGEASWPVLGSIKWWRRYHAMLATPLRVRDVMLGHVAWMLTRITVVCAVYFAVMAAFGTVPHASSVRTHRRLRRDAGERHRLFDPVPVRRRTDVPVLRHVLPDPAAAGRPAADRLGDATLARRRPLPVARPRDRDGLAHRRPRLLPRPVRRRRARGGRTLLSRAVVGMRKAP
jgi:hypothetical protein